MGKVTEGMLHDAQGSVNPLMVGHEAESILSYQEMMAADRDTAKAEVKSLNEQLTKAATQARQEDGSLDFSKIDLCEGTADDKKAKVMELNSKLHGAQRALSEHRRIEGEKAEADRIAELNGVEGATDADEILERLGIGPLQTMAPRQIELSQKAEASLKSAYEGLKFGDSTFAKVARTQGLEIEIPVGQQPGYGIMATDFQTGSWEPNRQYEPGWTPKRVQNIQMLPHIYSGPMPAKNMRYWVEKTQNSAAAGRAEGATTAESTYELEEKSYEPQSLAHYLPITEEALEDRGEIMEYIDYVMPLGLNQLIDKELGSGNAATNRLRGLTRVGYNTSDTDQPIRHKYLNGTEKWDVLLDAKLASMDFGGGVLGMQMPDTAFVTTKFWGDCLKSKSSAGGYYVGGPDQAMFAMPWGMNLVVVTHSFEDTVSTDGSSDTNYGKFKYAGAVMDTSPMFSKLCYRHGIRVRFGLVNDDFIKFKMAVRADVRCQMVYKRTSAVCLLVNPKTGTGGAPSDPTG